MSKSERNNAGDGVYPDESDREVGRWTGEEGFCSGKEGYEVMGGAGSGKEDVFEKIGGGGK